MVEPQIDPRPLAQALDDLELDGVAEGPDLDLLAIQQRHVQEDHPLDSQPLPFRGYAWKKTPCRFPDGRRP